MEGKCDERGKRQRWSDVEYAEKDILMLKLGKSPSISRVANCRGFDSQPWSLFLFYWHLWIACLPIL